MTVLPLSFAQRRLWFLERLLGANATFNLPVVLRLSGGVDRSALRAALADVAERHESLRTVFPEKDGEPHQRILRPQEMAPQLAVVPVRERDLDAAMLAAASAPFEITRRPPVRAVLFVLAENESVLLVVLHHIVSDGWSMAPLVRDLSSAYRARAANGRGPSWAELPVQYADYTLWQVELLAGADDQDSLRASQLTYWTNALRGVPETISLPTDRPRPAVASHRGAAVPVDLGRERHRELVALARRHDCTLVMVLHAALAVLLTRMGAGTDIPVGSVVAGRTEPELDDLVGLFVNTLVLRTDLTGDPEFREVLRQVRRVNLEALAHQDLPFDILVESLNPPRSLAHHPLFQVMLAFENDMAVRPDFGEVSAVRQTFDVPAAKVDLTLQLRDHHDVVGEPAGVDGILEYATDLFDERTARAVVAWFVRVLDAVVAEPGARVGDIDLLSAEERRQVLVTWNATDRRLPVTTLHEQIRQQAARSPGSLAMVFGEQQMSYAELDRRSNRLAHHLVELGVGPGTVVGVALPRSPDLVVSLLAVLKAGGAYLPLDPEHPPNRVAQVLRDARPLCVVTARTTRAGLPRVGGPVVDVDEPGLRTGAASGPEPDLLPRHPAYVMYTSGSTGRPKGVVVSHGATDNRLRWMQEDCPLTAADRVLHKTPTGFDVSVWELFWPLRVGATLVVAEPGAHRDPGLLARVMARHGVTVVHFVPSMLGLFLADLAGSPDSAPKGVRRVYCSGEALARETVDEFHRVFPDTELSNLYGPTEATVDVTAHRCVPGERGAVPIGRPVWNTRVRVLDGNLNPCPVGIAGELYLAGTQLAEGYLDRPALTAGRFVADPYGAGGTRMYRTGDLVRWRHDGALDFLGRDDDQVKLRGQRLELGEIESVLLTDESVGAACAVVRDDGHGGQLLVAYVSPAPGGHRPDSPALRRLLADRLPAAVVPASVIVLASLPLSPNGKVDRAALPAPTMTHAGGRRPGTPLEKELARLFEEVLGVSGVGVDDDFFALGGHSMLVVTLARRIRQAIEVEVPIHTIFRGPTVAALSRLLSGDGTERDADPTLLELRHGGNGVPLFFVHPAAGLSWCYSRVLEHIGPDRPVYGLQARTVDLPRSVGEMADDYVAQVRRVQPVGPYHLLGWSFGGNVAHAMAVRLRAAGEPVSLLAMFDSYPNQPREVPDERALLSAALWNLLGRPPDEEPVWEHAVGVVRREYPPLAEMDDERIMATLRVGMNNVRLLASSVPETYDGDLTVIVAERDEPAGALPVDAWQVFVTGQVNVVAVDSGHHEMFTTGAAATGAALASILRDTEPLPTSGERS
jgi:amino acid adenylation domain-containing protein